MIKSYFYPVLMLYCSPMFITQAWAENGIGIVDPVIHSTAWYYWNLFAFIGLFIFMPIALIFFCKSKKNYFFKAEYMMLITLGLFLMIILSNKLFD